MHDNKYSTHPAIVSGRKFELFLSLDEKTLWMLTVAITVTIGTKLFLVLGMRDWFFLHCGEKKSLANNVMLVVF